MAVTINGNGTITPTSAVSPTGSVLQVIQTKLNTAVSHTGAGGYTDISGFSAAITPSSASSKILVMVQMNVSTNSETYYQLARTAAGSTSAIGNGSAGNYNSFTGIFGSTARSGYYDMSDKNFNFLDDAQDTNEHTYKVQWANVSNTTAYLNRTGYGTTGNSWSYSGASSLTLMEIAG